MLNKYSNKPPKQKKKKILLRAFLLKILSWGKPFNNL